MPLLRVIDGVIEVSGLVPAGGVPSYLQDFLAFGLEEF